MIIRSIELTHYRGVTRQKVDLTSGITVIEGPNEVGKTSLVQALDLLFEFKDSSRNQRVRDTFPVDRDEGPCVEAEIKTGSYHFTYRKRFKKKPETQLTVHAPTPESLTGEEAHERAKSILAETLDIDLWKALQVIQGTALDQASLSDSQALATALDAASGSSGSGVEYGVLFDRAGEEYQRYFTGTGKESKDLKAHSENVDTLSQRLDDVKNRLEDLKKDTDRSAQLSERIRALDENIPQLETDAGADRSKWDEVSKLVEQAKTANAESETATLRATQAGDKVAAREKLKNDLAALETELSDLESSSRDDMDAWKEAGSELKKVEEEVNRCESDLDEASGKKEQCQADLDFRQDESEVERFNDRIRLITEAEETKRTALEVIESTDLSDEAYKELQNLEREVEVTGSQLAAGGPTVNLSAGIELDVEVDGEITRIEKGSEKELSIDKSTTIHVPNVLEVRVDPGSSIFDLNKAAEQAREDMVNRLREYKVESVAQAFDVLREIESARGDVKRADEQIKDSLRDLTRDEIVAKSMSLENRITDYAETRESEEPLPPDIESAEAALTSAAEAYSTVNDKWGEIRATELQARERLESLRIATEHIRVTLETKKHEIARLGEELKDAEKTVVLEKLRSDHERLNKLAEDARSALDKLETDLEQHDPDRLKALCESSEAALENGRKSRQDLITERSGVEGRLEANREQGLAEEQGLLEAELSSAQTERKRNIESAEAARLLYETLEHHRDEARRAYVAPLKSRIDKLGKVVFGPDFEVTLSNELTVESRTLQGITIPYSGFSGGAKEQMGLLVRIAAAMTVSEEYGVPLILDDTLGYSDPDRIKTMCAMLTQAGRTCQIIILTCTPDRFRGIGGAEFLRMA